MTRKERAKLTTEIRLLIERRQQRGERFTSASVYDFVAEELPLLLSESTEPLMRRAIRDISQKVMASKQKSKEKSESIGLFEAANMKLPKSITLPQDNGDLLWTPLDRVTPNEWQAHIDRVMSGGQADIASATEQQAALDMLKETLEPEELDTPICVIKSVVAKRRTAETA